MTNLSALSKARIVNFVETAIRYNASDIHLVSNHPPYFRIQGKLRPMELPAMEPAALRELLYEMMTDRQRVVYEETKELDFSYFCIRDYFFRVNVHTEKGNIAATIRIMPGLARSLDDLGLPPAVKGLTKHLSGLILIVGRAGTGKTTTLTHMIDLINHDRQAKIITIEDPIEYIYESKQSLIIQREVGTDTISFASGLKYALRQDPDVVVIGEMRDLESISMALTTAETGHLVFTTLHAPDALEAINRIIDVYPGEKQNQIRVQLAENLIAIIGQQLLPRRDTTERILASELMVPNLAIRNLIRRNVLSEIRSQMETGRDGMYTIEQSLSGLVKRGLIHPESAQSYAKYPNLLQL
jgi:twitching motility protein PilT